jgi:hypothetical protein
MGMPLTQTGTPSIPIAETATAAIEIGSIIRRVFVLVEK